MPRPRLEVQDDESWFRGLHATGDPYYARFNTQAALLDEEGQALAIPAPNAIEWVVGKDWCDSPSAYEYWGEYQSIRDYFELRCPLCNDGDGEVWGRSQMELEDEVLLRWSAEHQEDVCPKCATTRSEFVEDGFFHNYNTFHAVIGQRAGKSVVAALMGTFIEHRIITIGLSTPGGFGASMKLVLHDPFEMTFLAATAVQSSDTIWAKFTGIRADAPWFQRLIPWIKRQQMMQVPPEGMKAWVYRENDNAIVNMHPSIRLIVNSMNSNSPALRGRTRPAAFADEVSHMEQTDSKKSATAIYRALERSLRTVRSRVKMFGGLPWLGTMVSVTSPVTRGDKGMQLLADAKKVKTMFSQHCATWEYNPYEPRAGLQDEFDKDPIGAACDYGAIPPGAEHPLVHDEARWRRLAIDVNARPKADFQMYTSFAPTGQEYVNAKVSRCAFIAGRPHFIVWDGGLKFDAFAGACAHGEWVQVEGQPRLQTVYDWVVRLLPRPGTEVRFECVFEIMQLVKKSMHVSRVLLDRWQSFQLVQQIRELNIFAEAETTKDISKDYHQWKLDCFEGLVRMLPPGPHECEPGDGPFTWTVEPPEMSAAACAIYELMGMQCDPDSQKITAPAKGERRGYGSDDVAQCIVRCHALVQRAVLGFTDRQDDKSTRSARMRAEAGSAAMATRGLIAHVPRRGGPTIYRGGRGW